MDELSDYAREMTDASEQWAFIEAEAKLFGVGAAALEKWRTRGVPHRWRLPLLDRAAQINFILYREIFDHPPSARRSSMPTNCPDVKKTVRFSNRYIAQEGKTSAKKPIDPVVLE